MASYPWRTSILDNADDLLDALQQVDPELDESDFIDVVTTCEDLAAGELDDDDLAERAAERFGVDPEDGSTLVETARSYACP